MAWDNSSAGAGAASGAMAGSAAGPWGAAIGGVAGGLAGGFMGGAAKRKEEEQRRKQMKAQQEALARLQALQAPEYANPQYKQQDIPQELQSQFQGMGVDQDLRNKQLAQMNALQKIADSGGMTLTDKANYNQLQMQAAEADRGRREAIMQNAQMSGMASGGNTLLAKLQSQQAATNTQAMAGAQMAGNAQQRALDALQRQADVAGQVRGQDWQQNAQKAAAMDAISQFNQRNKIDIERSNIEMDARQQDMMNQLKQMTFNDQFKIASQIAAQLGMDAQFAQQMAMANAKERGELLNGMLSTGVSLYAANKKGNQS